MGERESARKLRDQMRERRVRQENKRQDEKKNSEKRLRDQLVKRLIREKIDRLVSRKDSQKRDGETD